MQYKVGTVAVTTSNVNVTGTNTKWLSNVEADWIFWVVGQDRFYEISTITDDTHLILSDAYEGATASGLSYAIVRDYTYNFGWPSVSRGDVDWAKVVAEALRRIDSALYETPEDNSIRSLRFTPLAVAPTPDEVILYFDDVLGAFAYYYNGGWHSLVSENV